MQQVDTLIREALGRRDGAARTFSETNADFNAAAEQLSAVGTTNQSAINSYEWAKASTKLLNPVNQRSV